MAKPFIRRWFGIVFLALLLCLPLLTNSYTQYILNLVLVYVVISIGLNFLLGYAGQFGFAHAALMGIGAYTTALLVTRLGMSFWLALPAAGLLTTLIGSVGAIPALRMNRTYLGLVTIAFAELVTWVLVHWKSVTLGTDGISLKAPEFFGYSLKGDQPVYYLLLPLTVCLYLVARWIVASRIGRSLVAIRENEIVAQCNGINLARTKALAFALSAFYAGIGGGMYALTLGFIVPESFMMFQLIIHYSLIVIGGLSSIFGSVLGAIVLTALPEILRDFQALQEIIYGLLLMVFVVFMPDGLTGLAKRFGLLPEEILVRNVSRLKSRSEGKASSASVAARTPI